ncbi:MAG TPA: right-handed parallel beta-helix repeat-containing protein [Streptosporangiales bacterium]
MSRNEGSPIRRSRGQWWWNPRVLGLLGVGLLVAGYAAWLVARAAHDEAAPAAERSAQTSTSAPAEPPARICGNRALLDGPAQPPKGAVRVGTSRSLTNVTTQYPPGTTFWLAPGVHRLGPHRFDQVKPKPGDSYIGAPGAVLDGQHKNLYAFAGDASDVTVEHLTVRNFGARAENNNEGVVNHDAATGWKVENNTVHGNAGAGVMVGSNNVVRNNCLADNGQYGFSAYHTGSVRHITIEHNEISGNNTDDWERRRPGCGCTGGGKFWMTLDAHVLDNWVHDNHGAGLWADTNNAGFLIKGNYLSGNDAEGVIYEASYNAAVKDNTFVRNALVKGPENPGFPTGALYLSESGSDERVRSRYSKVLEVTGNVFTDNWSGVILWENSDRFAGSPANTSTGAGTLVNPEKVTARTCNRRNIDEKPYIDDCRWKTQNVRVAHNVFNLRPTSVGAKCTASHGCGYNGIFANWGTYPSWSPYKGSAIQDRIVARQHNKFAHNVYAGPWTFMVKGQGLKVNWATWQSAPYGQDTNSVIKMGG